jgi:hypothetical protein
VFQAAGKSTFEGVGGSSLMRLHCPRRSDKGIGKPEIIGSHRTGIAMARCFVQI